MLSSHCTCSCSYFKSCVHACLLNISDCSAKSHSCLTKWWVTTDQNIIPVLGWLEAWLSSCMWHSNNVFYYVHSSIRPTNVHVSVFRRNVRTLSDIFNKSTAATNRSTDYTQPATCNNMLTKKGILPPSPLSELIAIYISSKHAEAPAQTYTCTVLII